jgi:hypothetical protein
MPPRRIQVRQRGHILLGDVTVGEYVMLNVMQPDS